MDGTRDKSAGVPYRAITSTRKQQYHEQPLLQKLQARVTARGMKYNDENAIATDSNRTGNAPQN